MPVRRHFFHPLDSKLQFNLFDQSIGSIIGVYPYCFHQVKTTWQLQEAIMISNFIDRWFNELLAWEPAIDILATLPDNF